MDKLKVYIADNQREVKIPSGLRLLVRRCCNAALVSEGFEGSAEINVTFVDDAQIRELNLHYRKKDSATDVLSFPMGENGKFDKNPDTGALVLGDVVISLERAKDQAAKYGHSMQREVSYLTVHSMLHILGYDHEAGGIEAMKMREKEEQILGALGLNREVYEV
ncbi:MAG: rRNA maturation RNase YbeY [Clostridia bacterium]|nr:rRNA maturation RNase YbeY [Clostridia bacterium]MDR3643555.1 rRNA maturation RNase YbeY [Clostridia bacterium]